MLTLTAPGSDVLDSADAVVAWNAGVGRRWEAVCRGLMWHLPGLEFARVFELQKRGAAHVHAVVRSSARVTPARVRKLALAAGFGPKVQWEAVRSVGAASRYLAKYLVKGGVRFPRGSRVLAFSRQWSLSPYIPPSAEGEFYAGPALGQSWADWAEWGVRRPGPDELAERSRRSVLEFESGVREMFAEWSGSARGVAAAARHRRE